MEKELTSQKLIDEKIDQLFKADSKEDWFIRKKIAADQEELKKRYNSDLKYTKWMGYILSGLFIISFPFIFYLIFIREPENGLAKTVFFSFSIFVFSALYLNAYRTKRERLQQILFLKKLKTQINSEKSGTLAN